MVDVSVGGRFSGMRELDRRRQLGLEENASRWLPYELKGMERGGGRLRKEPVTTRAALSRDARTGTRTVTLDCDSYRRYAGGARRGKVFRDLRSLRRSASRKENTGDPSLGPPRRGRKRCAEVSESTERRGRSDGVLQAVVPSCTDCRCSDNLSTTMRGLGLNDEWH
jgi:hypothetical protein